MKTTSKLIIFALTFLALAASAYPQSPRERLKRMLEQSQKTPDDITLREKIANLAAEIQLYDAVGAQDKTKVAALLAKGVDVNIKSSSGDTLLHHAAEGRKDIVQLLLAYGADVNAKGEFGGTPLHRALSYGSKDIVELLLDKGADVNAKSEHGTALHSAAVIDRSDIGELLLARGADVNAIDPGGNTPLHWATSQGKNNDFVELLLAKGANINAKNKLGDTPLQVALNNKKNDITELLIAKGANVNTMEPSTTVFRAQQLWETGDSDKRKEAMLLYRAALALAPADQWVLGQVGWALHRNGETKEALPLLERAAELAPNEESRYALAAVLFADKQYAKAAEQARWLVQQDPLDSGYLRLLGTTASWTDRYREQVDVQLTLLRIDPQSANAVLYSQLGVGQAALGDCVAARDTLRSAVRAFPDTSNLYEWLVVTTYCAAGRSEAESVWQERHGLRTYSDRTAFYQRVYYGIYDLGERAQRAGARYVALSHFARAYAVAREAEKNTRVNPQWVSEERAHLRSRMFELYRVLPLKPAIPAEAHALMQLGERALASGDWQTAGAQYAAAVEIAPWSPEARYDLGLAFGAALLNDLPQAIREMEFVQTLSEPASPLARGATDRLGVWRERQRKALEACGGRVEQNGIGRSDAPYLILTGGGC